MDGSTNAQPQKWTKGTTATNVTIFGYGLDITDTSHIYVSLNVAPDVTLITFTGSVLGRNSSADLYNFSGKTIGFAEVGLGQWKATAQIGTTTTMTAVIYQLTGNWTLS